MLVSYYKYNIRTISLEKSIIKTENSLKFFWVNIFVTWDFILIYL